MRGWMSLILALWVVGTASAQSAAPNAAFLNASGQVVVVSGDGLTRWIVTNPGERLAQPLGFSWSPDARRLFFAVDLGAAVSLRVGELNGQTIREIGQVSGVLSGGEWTPDSAAVLVAANDRLALYAANGAGESLLAQAQGTAYLVSPFANDRPYLPSARSLSPDGRHVFYLQGGYNLYTLNTGQITALNISNDANARQSGLWSDSAPLVAYWGVENGSSVLAVTNAANGQTLILNSGRTAPIAPLGWQPGTTRLIYRDTTNFIRVADLACLLNTCNSSPLQNGTEVLPDTAMDVQFSGSWLYFREGEQIKALNLTCIDTASCAGRGITLADRAAQRTWMHVGGSSLIYTAYTQDPANPSDREARLVDLRCLADPSTCAAGIVSAQAVGGLVSPDGAYVIIDQASSGLNIVNLFNRQAVPMSGASGGQLGTGLNTTQWSG